LTPPGILRVARRKIFGFAVMVWVASLTFVAQAVKKKIATEKKFRRAFFVAKKFEKDY
jgi:hypothetical protein